jgi:hypothetical protein
MAGGVGGCGVGSRDTCGGTTLAKHCPLEQDTLPQAASAQPQASAPPSPSSSENVSSSAASRCSLVLRGGALLLRPKPSLGSSTSALAP